MNHPDEIFTQATSVLNFSQIRPFLLKPPGYPKVLASFWRKLVPRPQKSIFQKSEKKNNPRYSRKEQEAKFQTNLTILEVSREAVFVTDRGTDKQAHYQILAQLKLRIRTSKYFLSRGSFNFLISSAIKATAKANSRLFKVPREKNV